MSPVTKISSITDGTSNTIAFAEMCHGKYSQYVATPGGGCDWEGAGWWADADYSRLDHHVVLPAKHLDSLDVLHDGHVRT